MANLFSRLFFNGNGRGIKGGAAGTTVCPGEHGRTSTREGFGAPGCPGGGAAPTVGGQPPGPAPAATQDPQCCSRKLVATFRSLLEALRASRASPRENPISMSRAT